MSNRLNNESPQFIFIEVTKPGFVRVIGGEFVLDIDANTVEDPHGYLPDEHGICFVRYAMVTRNDVLRHKPKPAVIHEAVRKMSISAD